MARLHAAEVETAICNLNVISPYPANLTRPHGLSVVPAVFLNLALLLPEAAA